MYKSSPEFRQVIDTHHRRRKTHSFVSALLGVGLLSIGGYLMDTSVRGIPKVSPTTIPFRPTGESPEQAQVVKPTQEVVTDAEVRTHTSEGKNVPQTRAYSLGERPDAIVSQLNCSKSSIDSSGLAIPLKGYADPVIGTILRRTPDPVARPVSPAFPKGEALSLDKIVKIVFPESSIDKGQTEYWALNPSESDSRRRVNRGSFATYVLVATEKNNDSSTRQMVLSAQPEDLDKCVTIEGTKP